MAVLDSMGKIARGLKDLELRWQDVHASWKDEVAERFYEKYLHMWQQDFRTTTGQMETMSVYLQQVRRDCE